MKLPLDTFPDSCESRGVDARKAWNDDAKSHRTSDSLAWNGFPFAVICRTFWHPRAWRDYRGFWGDLMPQRLLRPSIRQSKRWNRVPYFEQSLFIRLLTLVDDFARYEADPELIRSEAFPYGDPDGNVVHVTAIDSAMLSLASKDMILLYEVNGVKFMQLNRWKERVRADISKYPAPNCGHLLSNDGGCQQMLASPPQPSPTPTPTPAEKDGLYENTQTLKGLLNRLFSRSDGGAWTEIEDRALCEIAKRRDFQSEFDLLKGYRERLPEKDFKYFPQTVGSLLEKWGSSLDRARQFKEPKVW